MSKTIMKEVMEFANSVDSEATMSFQLSQNLVDFLELFLKNIPEKKLLKLREIFLEDEVEAVLVNSQITMIIMQALNGDVKHISGNEEGLEPINEVGGFIGGNLAINLDVDNLPKISF